MHYRKRKLLFAAFNAAGLLSKTLGKFSYWFQPQLSHFSNIPQERKTILILCHGNICRSPYVEQQLKSKLDPERYKVASGGLRTSSGEPANATAKRMAKERGIDLSEHQTLQVGAEDIQNADLILLMDPTHRIYLKELEPSALKRSILFGAFALSEGFPLVIADPYAKSDEAFQECFRHLDTATTGFLQLLQV